MINPGSYLTTDNRLSALLQSMPSTNNGTVAGGLGEIARGLLMGKMFRDDQQRRTDDMGQYNAAMQAAAKGMSAQPWKNPDTGEIAPGQNAGGYAGAVSALAGLQGNPYAGRLSADLMMKQAAVDAQRDQATLAHKRAIELARMKREMGLLDTYDAAMLDHHLSGVRDANKERIEVGLPPLPPGPVPGSGRSGGGQPPSRTPMGPRRDALPPQAPVAATQPQQPNGGLTEVQRARVDEATAVDAAKKANALRIKREEGYSGAANALQQFERQTSIIQGTIDEAIGLVLDNPGEWRGGAQPDFNNFSTGYGSFLSGMPNSAAGKLANALDTIKARIGFDELQRMRDNSPSGGALGQVSELENRLLQAVQGALDPAQPEQLLQNLKTIRELYPQVLAEKRRAFEYDYREFIKPEHGFGGQGVPHGVTPEEWEAMTPEERALWN